MVQPDKRSKEQDQGDRRDADGLGELLWTNRQRILEGKKVQNVRRIVPPSQRDAEDRQLTAVRQRAFIGTTADANDQPGAASPSETQLAAGMPDENECYKPNRHDQMADDASAGHDGPAWNWISS